MATNISFDSNSLQTTNIVVSDINHFSLPNKNANMFALAHANASKIPYVSYPSKQITVKGMLTYGSITALDAGLDTFKSYFLGTEKNLDIDYNGSTRRYIATVSGMSIDRPNGLSYARFTISFDCSIPFGQNTSTTTALSASGRTAASYSDAYTFVGTAPWLQPVATYTISALTGGTAASVSFGNNSTGQVCTVTRTWTAADVLVIDSSTKTVKVNGVEVAYTGAIPEFAPGSQTITYVDTLTTRTFTVSIVYYQRYL